MNKYRISKAGFTAKELLVTLVCTFQENDIPELDGPPFGKKALVVIYIGGGGWVIQNNILWKI